MSSNSISAPAPAAIYFQPHDHKKGAHAATATAAGGVRSTGGAAGQLPVSATSSLFSNLLQSLEQVVNVRSTLAAHTAPSVAATSGAGTSGATASTDVNGKV
jgi:hypothetical protein